MSEKSKEFEKHAKELGFSDVFFCGYGRSLNLDKIDAVIIKPKSTNDLRKFFSLFKDKKIRVESEDAELTRAALESKKVFMILTKKINHVLCKITSQNNVFFGINFSELMNVEGVKRAVLLSKIIKNLNLCRKFKVKVIVASFASTPEKMFHAAEIKSIFEKFYPLK